MWKFSSKKFKIITIFFQFFETLIPTKSNNKIKLEKFHPPKIDKTTIDMSKMFHGSVKYLQLSAINFMKHSMVKITIKMLLIKLRMASVCSVWSAVSKHIAIIFKNIHIIIKMSNFWFDVMSNRKRPNEFYTKYKQVYKHSYT